MRDIANDEGPDSALEPAADFVLYVDEAGDPGLKNVAPDDKNGSSEWFILSGVLLHHSYETKIVDWVKQMRWDAKATQGDSLHFRKLSDHRKIQVAQALARLPIRGFVIASHKKNMKGHKNARAAKLSTPDWYYNWCLRLLLERVTLCVERTCRNRDMKVRPIRIVLAERGGHSYSQTSVYLQHLKTQAKHGTTVLKFRQIVPEAIDWSLAERIQANQSAGAQLADIIASAFLLALKRNGTDDLNRTAAEALKPIMARDMGTCHDFGVVLQPPIWEAEMEPKFKDIFRFYDYVL